MLPINSGGNAAYQDTFISDFLTFYPDPSVPGISSLNSGIWTYLKQIFSWNIVIPNMAQHHDFLLNVKIIPAIS